MMYFHGPCLLLIAINIVIFYVTVKKIYSIRKELDVLTQLEDGMSRLRLQQNKFVFYGLLLSIFTLNFLIFHHF